MEDFAPGMRFYPTEEELVSFYLSHKLEGKRDDLNRVMGRVIPVLDIYEFSPWDLPQLSGDYSRHDPEQWFFFIPRQESEARGRRPRRLTTVGYWKATGSPGFVYSSNNRCIAVKRTMVFYRGRAPAGKKTEWKMNEYKAIEGEPPSSSTGTQPRLREELSLCRVYKKSKCLRSFDRRPLAVEIGQLRVQQGHGDDGARAIINHQNPPLIMERRSSSESSSSSDHHSYPSQIIGEGTNIMPIAIDNIDNPLWDWDQFNNSYYGGEYYM